jgi:hypothetical protein
MGSTSLASQFTRLHKRHIDAIKDEKHLLAHELRGQIAAVLSKAQDKAEHLANDHRYGSSGDTHILYSVR